MNDVKQDNRRKTRHIKSLSSRSDLQPGAEAVPKSRFFEQNGFTLLEVMIALVIVATVLIALLGLQNRTIKLAERQQKITRATMLAQERMTGIEVAAEANRTIGEDEGGFEEPYEDYRWTVDFEATPLATVEMVTVTVAWGRERTNEQVTLTSFLFR